MDTREWLKSHSGEVEAIILHKFRFTDRDKYRDVAQYVFYRMCRCDSLASFDVSKGSFRTYLYTCVLRFAMSYLKPRKTEPMPQACELGDDMASVSWESDSDASMDFQSLMEWLTQHVTPLQAGVVDLWVKGYDISEISRMLGVSRQNVDLMKQRAIRRVKAHYAV